jgi:hypothetical protein
MKNLKKFTDIKMKNSQNLYLELVYEKLKLFEKGYDELLVEEQLWDIGKFMFNNVGSAITQTIKGQLFEYMIGKLGISTDSYIALALKNMFANVPFNKYYQLVTDCDYFTSQFAKALIEAFIDQFRKSAGYDSLIHIALKELLVEAATKTDLYLKLQKKLTGFVCPLLKEFAGSVDMTVLKGAQKGSKVKDATKDVVSKSSNKLSQAADTLKSSLGLEK